MRAGASLGLRIATAVAFGATAVLSVVASRAAPVDAALTSANGPGGQHAAASGRPAAPARCALSGLRVSLGPGARVTTVLTRYLLEFTNVSGAPCTLAGYPEVAAYQGDDLQVGAAAGRDRCAAAHRVLLAPGQTAHAALDASVPAARCGPVRASGLRVVTPGQASARYVRRVLTACSASAPRGQAYLRVHPIQPGPGARAGAGSAHAPVPVRSAPAPARPARPAHPSTAASPHAVQPD